MWLQANWFLIKWWCLPVMVLEMGTRVGRKKPKFDLSNAIPVKSCVLIHICTLKNLSKIEYYHLSSIEAADFQKKNENKWIYINNYNIVFNI